VFLEVTDQQSSPSHGITLSEDPGRLIMSRMISSIFKILSYTIFAVLVIVAGSPLNTVLAAPVVTTQPATYVSSMNGTDYIATVNGTLSSLDAGTTANVYFQLGTSANYTRSTALAPMTVAGSFSGVFGTGGAGDAYLIANTTYHFRAVATAGNTTVVGGDRTFITTPYPNPPGQIVLSRTLPEAYSMYLSNLGQPGFILFHTEYYAPNGVIQEITGTGLTLSPY
jgi:hypothetical protein